MFPFRSGVPAPERGRRRGAWGRPAPPGEGPKRTARQLALAARRRRRRHTPGMRRRRQRRRQGKTCPGVASERSRITRGPFGPMRLASSLCLRAPLAQLHSATASTKAAALLSEKVAKCRSRLLLGTSCGALARGPRPRIHAALPAPVRDSGQVGREGAGRAGIRNRLNRSRGWPDLAAGPAAPIVGTRRQRISPAPRLGPRHHDVAEAKIG